HIGIRVLWQDESRPGVGTLRSPLRRCLMAHASMQGCFSLNVERTHREVRNPLPEAILIGFVATHWRTESVQHPVTTLGVIQLNVVTTVPKDGVSGVYERRLPTLRRSWRHNSPLPSLTA